MGSLTISNVLHSTALLTCSVSGKERESERERERERVRERERERDRQTDRQTETETETDRQRDRERDAETERDKETDRESDRQTDRQTEKQTRTQKHRPTVEGIILQSYNENLPRRNRLTLGLVILLSGMPPLHILFYFLLFFKNWWYGE